MAPNVLRCWKPVTQSGTLHGEVDVHRGGGGRARRPHPRQRARSVCAAAFGRRSRVKTPFLFPSARKALPGVAKSAKFHTCSPTTAGTRSKKRWHISRNATWYSSVHG